MAHLLLPCVLVAWAMVRQAIVAKKYVTLTVQTAALASMVSASVRANGVALPAATVQLHLCATVAFAASSAAMVWYLADPTRLTARLATMATLWPAMAAAQLVKSKRDGHAQLLGLDDPPFAVASTRVLMHSVAKVPSAYP